MKRIQNIIIAGLVLAFTVCLSGLYLTGCQGINVGRATSNGIKVAQMAMESYAAYSSGSPVDIAKAASDDLYGAAAIAQSYQGTNANVAAAVQGAKHAGAMAETLSKLPPSVLGSGGTITPETVSTLLTAASALSSK